MKKICVYATVAALASTTAMASKSRLQSLGEDKDGSYYISDTRNVFINPSELNNFSNRVFFEWGDSGTSFGNASLDQDSGPKAQGGVFHELSNGMKLGVNLGDETDVASLTRLLASSGGAATGNTLQTADNVLDLFLAGKASVNWGANLLYTSSESEAANAAYKQHAYALRLGANQDAWNAHALVALGAESTTDVATDTNNPSYKGKLGFRLGGGYDLSSENKVFSMYESYAWDQKNVTQSREGSFNKAIVGFGHTKKITDGSTLFAKFQGDLTNVKLETGTGAATEAKITRMSFPVTIGFEHAATEWLVLRGSVVQNIYGTVKDSGLSQFGTASVGGTADQLIRYLASARYGSSTSGNGGKKTLASSTAVNAGMTLKFGKLDLDGNIGAVSGDRATTTVGSGTNKGVLTLDNLETRVAMTYNF